MTTYNKIEIENKLINEYELVIDDMSSFLVDNALIKIKRYTFYRQYTCPNFYTDDANVDSKCIGRPFYCEKDAMGCKKDMRIRLNKIINLIEPETKELTEPRWLLIRDPNDKEKEKIKCVCGHNIGAYNFAVHIPTNIGLLLGIECIGYIEKNLNGQIKCKICNTLKNCEDRRIKPFNLKCCSMECYDKLIYQKELQKKKKKELEKKQLYEDMMTKIEKQQRESKLKREKKQEEIVKNYRIEFGKHWGEYVIKLPHSYIDWILANIDLTLRKHKLLKKSIEYHFDVIEEYEYY